MNDQTDLIRAELIRKGRKLITRRHFFKDCGVGVGSIALASLLKADLRAQQNPLSPKPPQFPAKAKRVIYLFQAGGPSHLDLFDYKPALAKFDGTVPPPDLLKNVQNVLKAPCASVDGQILPLVSRR